jgi:MFS family permease
MRRRFDDVRHPGSRTKRSPLWRNQEFLLLMAGQLLSTTGSQLTTIAYPLLVLAVTHSPAKAGLVAFARLVPFALFALLAGLAADRWNRRRVMITADAVRALAVAGLAAAILFDRLVFWHIPVVAFVEGTGSVFFGAAATGALRAVVPRRQLPDAVGAQEARGAAVRLAGPPLGGSLFGLARAVPFLVDAVSYAFSILSLLAMRTPFQEERVPETSPLRSQLAEGFRFLWSQPFLRTCAFLYGLGNFTIPGVLFVVVIVGERQGLSGGAIGALVATFAAGTLIGALVSPLLRRTLSIRAILLLELWTGIGSALFVIWPNVYVLAAGILPQAVALPVTDSVVVGYRIAITPDRLLGRVESVRTNISLLIAPLGPLVAGLLLSSFSARAAVACFVGITFMLAFWGTLSPSIRNAPSLHELDDDSPPTMPAVVTD